MTLSSTNWGVPKVGNPWPRLMASCVFASAVKAAKRLGVLRLGWIASEGVNVEKATVTVLVRDRCVVAVRRMQVVMDFMGGGAVECWQVTVRVAVAVVNTCSEKTEGRKK